MRTRAEKGYVEANWDGKSKHDPPNLHSLPHASDAANAVWVFHFV
jgi:hypothetical protein